MGPPVEYVGGQLQREQTRPLPDVSADTLKRSRIVLKFSSNTSSAEPLVPHKPLTPPTPAEDHLIDEERDHAPNYHHPYRRFNRQAIVSREETEQLDLSSGGKIF